ncbi:MAG: hypothetical protein ACP5LD_15995, partial [Desulfomonilaceae bacterium]
IIVINDIADCQNIVNNVGAKNFSPLGESPIHVWQRNYYEHIIRNAHALQRIRQYIVDNPMKWELDMENTNATKHQIN